MYSVVEFTKTRTVEVVATCWISQKPGCDELLCFWPNSNNVTKLARDQAPPDKNKWRHYQTTSAKRCTSQVSCDVVMHVLIPYRTKLLYSKDDAQSNMHDCIISNCSASCQLQVNKDTGLLACLIQ